MYKNKGKMYSSFTSSPVFEWKDLSLGTGESYPPFHPAGQFNEVHSPKHLIDDFLFY